MSNSNVAVTQSGILTASQEEELLSPISKHCQEIQKKIDVLRVDGTDKIYAIKSEMASLKKNKEISDQDRKVLLQKDQLELTRAKEVEKKNASEVHKLIQEGESYLKEHFEKDYFSHVKASCEVRKAEAKNKYSAALESLNREHTAQVAKINGEIASAKDDSSKKAANQSLKDENYVQKNRLYDAKMSYQKDLQAIKDDKHQAFLQKYHFIDLFRNSKFTLPQQIIQKGENYIYQFNARNYFLKNGLYIAIIAVFIILCIIAPFKGTALLTWPNILTILEQASPRIILALGVGGLILLAGTDLSLGRMVGMGMVMATMILHNGPNTGTIFGAAFDLSSWPDFARIVFAFFLCIVLCAGFSGIAGFFTAKFKIHPFITTMANCLIIFGLLTYATKGVSFGAIKSSIANMITPYIGGFPSIILWAIAAIFVIWFIWNKTKFGKNLYAVGGNTDAAAVSGINVFWVTVSAFILAGVMYGIASVLECSRMHGSGSAAYGQGWDMDAIAACVVGGISFFGGIGKVSGAVVGALIFTGLTYGLTVIGIDTNIQFVIEGIIIVFAVTLDSLKYIQKK